MTERRAFLCLDGWAGRTETPCIVVGETPKKFRIRATQRMRLAGWRRWLAEGAETLVPRRAIKFNGAEE